MRSATTASGKTSTAVIDKEVRPVTPRGCTNFKTRQLGRLLSRHYDAEVARAGLKTTQFSLLSHVLHLGPIAPGDVAQRMGMDAPTLRRNLRPLIDAGWLVQDPGPDARSRRISLTDAGRAKHAEAARYWKTAQRTINERLGTERVAVLHDLLDDCTARLRSGTADTKN
ncbi:MAG: MarR family winged helix-turn-helix transcriptional regulator [Sulfuritalea sp.]|nr:MarR family winged helix-turn-helix transcriptional regulator [Sulfuritalea sp.]